ncbi:MAG: thiamine pyrophosphate-binding protein, partial [Actinomycetota bacterium]|nr:thiamine pyrophosphate-binding protein [Actinomycetota bacterium]
MSAEPIEQSSSCAPGVVGGHLVARRLKAHGVTKLFTLAGGHLFSIYDGCRAEGIDIVDVRHEQSAAFAAEGWAKVTRRPGVAALTAGPGVTNGMSAIASAQQNHSPMLVLGGRAPAMRWGKGSLQELDHVPVVAPLTKFATTAQSPAEIPELVDAALAAAIAPYGGAAFVDLPLDHVFGQAPEPEEDGRAQPPDPPAGPESDGVQLERAVAALREAELPVVMAGSDLYWGHGERALLTLIEELRIPVVLNGLARGCVPADHELFFSRARREALKRADLALVIGAPMDFRLGFGEAFGDETELIVIDRVEPAREHPRPMLAELYGGLTVTLDGLRGAAAGARPDRGGWIGELRGAETAAREAERAERADDRAPLHPMRVYAELAELLDRDAIVIGDGGDFASYAGR